jgi:hypothetical protein
VKKLVKIDFVIIFHLDTDNKKEFELFDNLIHEWKNRKVLING